MKMILKKTNNRTQDFIDLTQQLDRELADRYGTMQALYDEHNVIDPIDTAMVGYVGNLPVACGCFKKIDEKTVEIKRMYVDSTVRRKGLSVLILNSLEKWAARLGFIKAVLETGKGQPEAIGLYQKSGYQMIENYGPYKGMDTSVCMAKSLTIETLLILPGKDSPENDIWLQHISDQLSSFDFKIDSIRYDHWDKTNDEINIPNELKKIKHYFESNKDTIIVAKSIGIILSLIANQQQIQPNAAVFMGAPVKENQAQDFIHLIMPAQFPILMIQQKNDKLTSFNHLNVIITKTDKENIILKEINGCDHRYDDFKQIYPILHQWFHR